jgi:hypothetical protein
MSSYAGQGIQNISSGIQQTVVQPVQNFIQPFQSISQTNPIQAMQMGIVSGIQNFTNPQQQIPVNATINSTNFNQTLPSLQGMTLFVPYGGQAQTQVNNLNAIVYDPVGGGFIGTTVPYGHSISNIVTSGSSGSLQSGMFSTKPLTPVVYTQESAGTVYSAAAVPAAAALVLASPASYSRLGAEAYGGYVAPLDARTIQSTGAQMGVYPASSGNLANLVDPYGVNQPKSAWTEMPWNTPVMSTPGIYSLGTSGIMTPISTQGMASIGMAAPVMSAALPGVGFTKGAGGAWNPFVVSAASPIGYISEGWQMPSKGKETYAYRNDPLAIAMEGAAFFGDFLLMGVAKPGAAQIERFGQTTTPVWDTFSSNLAAVESQKPQMDQLGSHISATQTQLNQMTSGKLNAQGQFTGTESEYAAYKSALADMNADVATYNQYGEKVKGVVQSGFATGAIIPAGTSGGYRQNPDMYREYGAFSEWRSNISQSLRGGTTEAQIAAYEQSPAFKNAGAFTWFGEGSWKVLTDPVGMAGSALQGVELYAGMGLVSAGFTALAPAAVGGITPAATGIAETFGATGLRTMASPIFQYGTGAAFLGAGVWGATEGFTAPAERSVSNLGGMTIHLAAMTAGALAPEGFGYATKGYNLDIGRAEIIPSSGIGEATATYKTIGISKSSGSVGQIERISTVFGGARTTPEGGTSYFFGSPKPTAGEFTFATDAFGNAPTFAPKTPLETYMVSKLTGAESAKINLGLDIRGTTSGSGLNLQEVTPAVQNVIEGYNIPNPRGVSTEIVGTMKEYNARLYGSSVQQGVGVETGIPTLGRRVNDLDVMIPGNKEGLPQSSGFAQDIVARINRAAGGEYATIDSTGAIDIVKVGNSKLFDIHNMNPTAEELLAQGSNPRSSSQGYVGLGMKEELPIMTKEGVSAISYSEQTGRKLVGVNEYTPFERTVTGKETIPTQVTGNLAPRFEGRMKDIGDYYFGERANIAVMEKSPNPITQIKAGTAGAKLESWLDLWGSQTAETVRSEYTTRVSGREPISIDFANIGNPVAAQPPSMAMTAAYSGALTMPNTFTSAFTTPSPILSRSAYSSPFSTGALSPSAIISPPSTLSTFSARSSGSISPPSPSILSVPSPSSFLSDFSVSSPSAPTSPRSPPGMSPSVPISPSPSPSRGYSPSPSPFTSPAPSPSRSPLVPPPPSTNPWSTPIPSRTPPSLIPPSNPYTTTSTPPWTPSPPTTPVPPPIPGFPNFPQSGPGPFQRKRRAAFTEIFGMGLDFSIKKPSKRQGKLFTSPKKPAARKGGKKK